MGPDRPHFAASPPTSWRFRSVNLRPVSDGSQRRAAYRTAVERWPQLEVSEAEFDAFVRGHHGDGLPDPFDGPGVLLAVACARGDADAVVAFRAAHDADIDVALRRLGFDELAAGDVASSVLEKLFTGEVPKIASFAGGGSLSNWVRAVVTRAALSVRRTSARRDGLLEAAGGELTPADPELAYLKRHYRIEFGEAFRAAMETLSPRDTTVLRHRFVDGLTLDQLAAACGVHRATAARWLAGVRQRLLESTRAHLSERLSVEPGELESIFRLIQSNFEVSVRGLLREEPR